MLALSRVEIHINLGKPCGFGMIKEEGEGDEKDLCAEVVDVEKDNK